MHVAGQEGQEAAKQDEIAGRKASDDGSPHGPGRQPVGRPMSGGAVESMARVARLTPSRSIVRVANRNLANRDR
jgi:hypothetical protein